MKALAYTIFVISVLLVSGFARADLMSPFVQQAVYETPIRIDDVAVNKAELQLLLQGNLPNPCFQLPSATLTEDTKRPNTLILRLSSPFPLQACVQRIQPYSTVVDLPVLAQASAVNIDRATVYVIKTEGYDFEMQVAGYDLIP